MTSRARNESEDATVVRETGGRWFWSGLVVGWMVMAYAAWGIVGERDATNPAGLARWVVGGALAHDLLLAPAVLLIGAGLARWLPAPVRGPVSGALASSGIVVLFAYPLLRGFGRHPLNASALPLDYRTNVIVVLVLIWLAAGSIIAFRAVRRDRR